MNNFYEELKSKAFSAFRALARECAPFEDANMLVGSADTEVSLTRSKISKTIDHEWIEKIENSLGTLDAVIRNPSVAIEDVDEILPVELSKHITEKSIKHLAQHTNYILDVKDDGEVVPLKILNVFHEETYLTYENKFVNTLLSRLSAFVDKRLRALGSASGIEMDYKFNYSTEFEHLLPDDGGRNSARINLRIELTSPLGQEMSESDLEINERFIKDINRVKRINMALISFRSSAFAEKMGKNYIRPPVIRTNAILRNKNLRELLNLWEYIEEYDKVGYSFVGDKYYELPSSDFVGGMYSSIALQYLTLYSGIAGELENNRLVSEKHLFETLPEFDEDIEEEEIDDYMVYDSEYRKTVPVSRLMNNRKKLSEDEKKIRAAILVSLKADEIMNEELLREEAEKRRLAREKRLAEEEERRRREEEAAKLFAEEQAKREVEIRYRRSFLSRYIQAESYVQDYYTEIKNELLSYKGVKSRISWSKETFNRGRIHLAKMDVKGKALYLYLALDPAALEGTKYKFTLAKGDCPVLLKIKSERKKKYALELIAQLMAGFGLVRIEREAEDYHLPYEDNEALIERGLIKVILPKGESLDENTVAVKADLSGIESKKPEVEEETPEAVEETAEETEEIIEAQKREVEIRYRRSFLSRYIQAESYVQDYYTEIKNELLSYKGVKSRISWSKETFKRGRMHLAKMDVKGKALYLYLALDPTTLEGTKYKFTLAKGDCPVLLKIKSERKKKYALELIAQLMAGLGLVRIEREAEDYHLPYEDNEALIERGLIKVILPKGESLDENAVAVKADLSGIESKKPEVEEETPEAVEETAEETEEIIEAQKREVEIRYRRSFLSRYIQSESYVQDYYTEIKNELLSYKGVKSRISWSKETFKRGRMHLAKMDVKGKALYLYLALDPAALEGTKYKFTLAKGDCPVLLKIKSERKKKYALELIAQLMAGFGLVRIEREAEDYRLPYEDNEALIERGLIKVILPKGESLDENTVAVKADLSGIESKKPETEQKVADENVKVEEIPEAVEENDSEAEEITETEVEETVEVAEETPETEEIGEVVEAETENVAEISANVEEELQIAEEKAPEVETCDELLKENLTKVEEETEKSAKSINAVEDKAKSEPEAEESFENKLLEVENEIKLEARLEEIIKSSIDGRSTRIITTSLLTPVVSRGARKVESLSFAFLGGNVKGALFVVPYTREQYLALPRKKKKSVLMSVKALLRYAATERAIKVLKSYKSQTERMAQRIARLEAKLAERRRILPTASLWADAVKRVVK